MKKIAIYFFINIIFLVTVVYAKDKLPVPRFVSIKSGQANIRTGPNVRYPIKWIFINKNEPVEVIAEFEQWRKIKDFDGEEGWIHESILTGKRFAIIKGENTQVIYKNYNENSAKVVKIEPKVHVKLEKCVTDWCKISVDDYAGWIKKEFLWGVYRDEIYK